MDAASSLPLTSVIVRSMDRPTLPACLDSIGVQVSVPVEVVVVNARGPDHAPLPGSAGPHRVRPVHCGRPLPRPQAANAGLDAACGRFVIFLDDDDVFLPGHLARLLAALQARPDAVAAHADVAYGHMGPDGWQTDHVFDAEFDPIRLRFENFLPLHAVLVDRGSTAWRDCRFDETLPLFEDWDWWLQLSRLGPFVHVPGISARYMAAAGGGSGVFADNAATAQARQRLLHKWLALDSADQRLDLLLALQTHYRAAHQAADRLALAQRTEEDLRAILGARDREIAAFAQQLDDLHKMVSAREREVADGLAHAHDLQQVVAARDDEIARLKLRLPGGA